MPWKSSNTRLKFSLHSHKLSWSVRVEATFRAADTEMNTAPSISQAASQVTVKVGSSVETRTVKVGTPVDLEKDYVWVSAW